MFLVGGPPHSGSTLLAWLLNQDGVVCLDEPNFQNPARSHRGISRMERQFPDHEFPEWPATPLSYAGATVLIRACESAIAPVELGVKFNTVQLIGYGEVYRRLGLPVVFIVRDIRDALATPLPPWQTERKMNRYYCMVWDRRDLADAIVRYEDLVAEPDRVLAQVSRAIGRPLEVVREWDPRRVPSQMLKSDRHELLRSGAISRDRVGLWRMSRRPFSARSHATAELMGYEAGAPA